MKQIIGYPTLEQGLEYLKKYVREKEGLGEQTLIFSEDRLTLLVEQAVCEELGGSFLTKVSTFARFLSGQGKTLSKQGSVMVIGKILSDNADKLHCFSAHSFAKNGAQAVYEMISQLSASKVTPEMLTENEIEGGLLKNKLEDLAFIYREYADFLLKNGYLDENTYLSLLPEMIKNSPSVRGNNVVFLGFTSFTAQALDGVRAACESAKNVLSLLPAGTGEIYSLQAASAVKKVCMEYGDVKVAQLKIGKEHMDTATVLREKLYDPAVFSAGFEKMQADGKIFIDRFSDREDELETVCARIEKYVAEGGRYSDVTVFLPDAKSYALLLNKVFGAYHIPYYADFKRSLATHPFAFFLFSLLRCVAENASPDAVQALSSSPYFGDSGEYRNYVAKFCNYRGGVKREIKSGDSVKGYHTDYLQYMRQRLLSAMEVFSKRATGADFCSGVRKIYALFEIKEKTEKLVTASEDDLQKEYLVRMDRELETVLSETETWLGGFSMTVSEFADILKNGLTACELSLLPLYSDEVFVGDVAQSRIAGSEVVFALGMNDSVPLRGEDTALLSDSDIKRLDEVQLRIEPSVAQVNARAKENICLNLCSFREKLYLSYSTDGEEECGESEILRYVRKIFDITTKEEDLFAYRVCRPTPALKVFLKQKEAFTEGMAGQSAFSTLYYVLSEREEAKDVPSYLSSGELSDFISKGEELFFSREGISPTLLEKYHDCPYKNFSEQGLKLNPREETAVMVTDTGTFVHEILEETAKNCDRLQTEEECRAFAYDLSSELLKKPKFSSLADTAAGEYRGERLKEECADIAVEMFRQIVNSNFKVKYTEYPCSLPKEGLFGKVDRVDECGDYVRIIDYKTGHIDDSAADYYAGTKMQLQLYMSAVGEDKVPAGIYYFPASLKFSKEGDEPFRMKGFMNGDKEVIKNSDLTLTEDGKEKSRYVDASLGGATSERLMDTDDFRRFIAYSVLASRKSVTELKQGFIAPTPYKESCKYCHYKGMCGAYGKIDKRQPYSAVKCATICEIVKRETGEKE